MNPQDQQFLDQCAIAAMQEIVDMYSSSDEELSNCAKQSYRIAHAMLTERKKRMQEMTIDHPNKD